PGNPGENTGLAGETLAASKSYLDALGVGFLIRQAAKIPGATQASEAFYNTLLGENKPFEQRAKEMQEVTKAAQEANPVASGAGTVAGIVAPIGAANLAAKGLVKGVSKLPGAAKIAAAAPKTAAAAKLLGTGAVEAGT